MVVMMHCTEREGLIGVTGNSERVAGRPTKRGGASSRGQQKQVYACVSVWRPGRTGAFERAYARGRAKSESKRHKIDLDHGSRTFRFISSLIAFLVVSALYTLLLHSSTTSLSLPLKPSSAGATPPAGTPPQPDSQPQPAASGSTAAAAAGCHHRHCEAGRSVGSRGSWLGRPRRRGPGGG